MDERRWVSALLDIVIVPPARLVIQSGDFDFPDSYDDLFGIDLVFFDTGTCRSSLDTNKTEELRKESFVWTTKNKIHKQITAGALTGGFGDSRFPKRAIKKHWQGEGMSI